MKKQTELENYEMIKAWREHLKDHDEGAFKNKQTEIIDQFQLVLMNLKSMKLEKEATQKLMADISIKWRDKTKEDLIERLALMAQDGMNNFRQCEKLLNFAIENEQAEDGYDGGMLEEVQKLFRMMNPEKAKPSNEA